MKTVKVIEPAPLYPISDVSDRTGVNPVTLRAWERRYGLLKPGRTDKGHRLYSEQDVQRVQQILAWLAKGVAISRVRVLLSQDQPVAAVSDDADWESMLAPARDALANLDLRRLEQQLNRALAEYPLTSVLAHWVAPLQMQMATHLPGQPAAAGVLHGLLRTRLGLRQWQMARRSGRVPRVLVMPVGTQDDLDALAFTAVLLESSLPAVSLPSLPSGEALRLLVAQPERVRALLLVLTPGISRTRLNRLLGATPRHLAQPLYACGDGVRTLPVLPAGLIRLPGDAASVASQMHHLLDDTRLKGERLA